MARKATRHTIGTVTIYQRDRHWHASYTANGVRTRQALKVTNLKVAQQKAREIADMIERGEYVTLEDRREQRNMTFGKFVTEFKDKHKGWGNTTWRGVKGIIKQYEDEWGHLPLSAINTRMVESFITRCIDCDGITNATANRRLACLKTIFKMAKRWGLLVHNPAERIKTMKEEPKVPRALSESETHLFLSELPDYAQVLATVAIDTGMRKSELYRLQWQDIDFERRLITVRNSKNNTFRVIPMTNRVYDTLQAQRQKGIIPYVLVGKDGNPEQSVRDVLSTVGKKVGIGHVHLHMLRHTFATFLRERGVALDRIMELLGHKTMVMTLRYAKSSPTQLWDAIESLNTPLPTRQTQQG
jgi:integrase